MSPTKERRNARVRLARVLQRNERDRCILCHNIHQINLIMRLICVKKNVVIKFGPILDFVWIEMVFCWAVSRQMQGQPKYININLLGPSQYNYI